MKNRTAELLFEFLRKALYSPADAKLDFEELDEEYVSLGKGLAYFAQCVTQLGELAQALARGDLNVRLPPSDNEMAAPLKSLHASLKHLTWQSQQVAKGDYMQRVDFMGDFSDAFNTMIEQLAERQKRLEDEIEQGHNKTRALEQINRLLSNITQHIPQQIIVIERDTDKPLFLNFSAQAMVDMEEGYVSELMKKTNVRDEGSGRHYFELQYSFGEIRKYLAVTSYAIEWEESEAEAFVVNDISVEKNQILELETYAYRDSMTGLYNRFYGLLELGRWLEEKRRFALIFADLDNLKYINDRFGHSDGDRYIVNAARHLTAFSEQSITCRLGGDEFMLLCPEADFEQAGERMEEICRNLQADKYLEGKAYYYRVSYGVVSVHEDNTLSASDILSLADERMYEHKRARKKSQTPL